MLEYKVSTDIAVPAVLTVTNTGLAHAGVAFGSVIVTVYKADGTTVASFVPTVGQWLEKSSGAYVGSGRYTLIIPAANTNQIGPLSYAVAVVGDDVFENVVILTDFLPSDIVTSIKGASNKDLTQVDTDVSTGTSTTATNISNAVTSIKGASNRDLTQVDADIGGVLTAIAGAITSIKGASNKDLTQVDTDVNALSSDILSITAMVQRILSLSYDNVVEDSQTYDTNSKLLSSRVRFYDTAAHAVTNDGVTGLLYQYAIAGAYDGGGNCTMFRMVRNDGS